MPENFKLADLAERNPVIWGAGLEAQGVLRRLAELGLANVTVAVDRPGKNSALIDQIAGIGHGTKVVVGADAEASLLGADMVIASPSIPRSNPMWSRISEVDTTTNIWMAQFGARALAITGSKGKSTTTNLLGRIVAAFDPDVAVGGNIGVPFFDLNPQAANYVVEVGSPQCERLTHSPRGGGITALFAEHLDFHGGLQPYYEAKLNLFAHGSQFVVTSKQAEAAHPGVRQSPGSLVVPSEDFFASTIEQGRRFEVHTPAGLLRPVVPIALRGAHNLSNLLIALAIAWKAGFDVGDPRVEHAIEQLPQLDHRLEVVVRRAGVEWVDDSLATAPQPTAAALAVYAGRPVVLIIGGFDRGVDFAPLADAVQEHGDVALVTVPSNGERIAATIRAKVPDVKVSAAADLSEAVGIADRFAQTGAAVIFSPASPSDASHVDYRSRSRQFRQAIAKLP